MGAFSSVGVLDDDTVVTLKSAHAADSTIRVTKLTLSITTHANNKQVTIRDTGDVVIAAHTDFTAAAGVPSTVTWDFGSKGVPLTAGENLVCETEASGVDGLVYCEGFEVV